jgi:putative DNA primase/helicase
LPAHDRELWVRVGMAIKSELGEDGFNLWDEWSRAADNYRRELRGR